MEDLLEPLNQLLADPFVAKLLEVLLGIIVIALIFRAISALLAGYLSDSDTRYRSRKLITLVSYVLMLLFAASVFSDSLSPDCLTEVPQSH